MNILHIRSQYIIDGGVETFINALFTYMDTGTFKPVVVLLTTPDIQRPPFCKEICGEKNIPIYEIPWTHNGLSRKTWDMLLEIIQKHEIKILHTHDNRANILGFILRKFKGVPFFWVSSAHGWVKNPLKSRIIGDIDKIIIGTADKVHFASSALFPQVKMTVPKRKLVNIPYFIEVDEVQKKYNGNELKNKWNIPLDSLVLGMVGRLGEEKGHVYLLKALVKLVKFETNLRLVLVGDGVLREQLKKMVRDLGIQDYVVFTGYFNSIAANSIFDIFVHSSLSETLSMVILEALHLGKPIVATTVGANGDVIFPGVNGFLVPPADSDALAEKMMTLIRDKSKRESFGRESIRLSQQYVPQNIALQYQQLYDSGDHTNENRH